MSNYKQTTVVGESWVRAYSVNIINPVEGNKTIHFQEEKAIMMDDGDVLTKRLGELSEQLTEENIGTEFELLNPFTGEVIGTSTYGQAYSLIHSLYMHAAKKRDALLEQEPPMAVSPPEIPKL